MKNLLLLFVAFFFLGACSTTEEEQHKNGYGELIREGYPTEINPFNILKKTAQGLVKVDAPTIIREDADDYLPLKLAGTSLAYIFSIKVSAKDYTKEEYLISLRTLTNDWKDCSEAKEVTFYRIKEEDGIAEYRSYIRRDQGVYLFLAQRELPSYDWYKVLKVCSTEKNKGFRLEGVVL